MFTLRCHLRFLYLNPTSSSSTSMSLSSLDRGWGRRQIKKTIKTQVAERGIDDQKSILLSYVFSRLLSFPLGGVYLLCLPSHSHVFVLCVSEWERRQGKHTKHPTKTREKTIYDRKRRQDHSLRSSRLSDGSSLASTSLLKAQGKEEPSAPGLVFPWGVVGDVGRI